VVVTPTHFLNFFSKKACFLLTRPETRLLCGDKWGKVVGSRTK
jgi:hypothetical protein